MARNACPKLDEWRDGKLYSFRVGPDRPDPPYPTTDRGRLIVYEVQHGHGGTTETLATCWEDGLQEMLASFFADGFEKGRRAGREERSAEIRRVLGIRECGK